MKMGHCLHIKYVSLLIIYYMHLYAVYCLCTCLWAITKQKNVSRYHITLLELYPIVFALYLWGSLLANQCIMFFTDNSAVVDILNSQTSTDKTIMVLVRQFVVLSIKYNILFKLKHIPGHTNTLADALSHCQIHQARIIRPSLQQSPEFLPHHLKLYQLLHQDSSQILLHLPHKEPI